MVQDRETAFLKGALFVLLFYIVIEHFVMVKGIIAAFYDAVSPLIYGVVIFFVVNLIVVKLENYMIKGIFENKAVRRATSIVIAFLILSGIIALVCFNMIPEIVYSAKQIADKAPQNVIDMVRNFKIDEEMISGMFGLMESQSVIDAIKASGNVVGSILAAFARFFIGLFFAVYILVQKESISAYGHRLMETYLPERFANALENLGHITYETYANFITGQCLDAVILGSLLALCMWIMGLSYPVLIGIIVGVTALIPVVGAFFGGTVGTILLVMESPIKAVTFLALFLILQQIDNRIIYPHVVGNAIGIPSILIFAAIIIGGKFGGVVGMFLGIPFTAVIYTMIEQDMEKRRRIL